MKDIIFKKFKKYILEMANDKYPNIRKREFSLDHYLTNFIHVLSNVTKWEVLKELTINANTKKYHWVSVKNEYYKWVRDNIFEDAFNKFVKENYFKISKIRKNKKVNLFIDVTKITNKSGSEMIAINGEYKKKCVTSLAMKINSL